jgi:hypothetical protein
MFDEHALFLGDREKKIVELLFVILLERAERTMEAVLQDNFFGELLEFEFESHKVRLALVFAENFGMSTPGRSSKFQASSSRETSSTKLDTAAIWLLLEPDASLELGT